MNETDIETPGNTYQKALGDIDKMNKDLDQLKEDLFKAKATQFNPSMVEKLRTVKEDCSRCKLTVNMHLRADRE